MPEWRQDLVVRLSGLRLSPAREAEIIEELSIHLDDRYAELRAAGESPDRARETALAELREHDLLARGLRTLRQARAPEPIAPGSPRRSVASDLMRDLRYAVRMLRRTPGFTAAAVLTLALGIGANTAIFSLINAALFTSLPVPDPDRLVYVFNGPSGSSVFSYPGFADLRDDNGVVEPMAAWGGITVSLNAGGEVDVVTGAIVTGAFFRVLGLNAALGRPIAEADDVTPGGHPVVVLGHSFWTTRFGQRDDIVGETLILNGVPFTVIGVMPPGFGGAEVGVTRDIYVPMMMQAVVRPPRAGYAGEMDPDLLQSRQNGWLYAIGRLMPGVERDRATSALSARATALDRERVPEAEEHAVRAVAVADGMPGLREGIVPAAWLLLAVVGTVLLIACANVANLLLSRASSRRREIAVRLAMGASRTRLVRQLLTESVLLAAAGGALGVALAWGLAELYRATPPPAGALPIALDFRLDLRVLGLAAVLAVSTGVVFGLAPALAATRPALLPALKDDIAMPDVPERRVTLRTALVTGEVALSLALLVMTGLLVRSLLAVRQADPGIDAARIVTAPLDVSLLRYTTTQGREFYARAVESAEAIPGVESAAVARVGLLSGSSRTVGVVIDGVEPADPQAVSANVVGPGYFRTLGIAFLRGRDFESGDTPESPLVAVVNQAFAERFASSGPALGMRLRIGRPDSPWRTVVGVVETTKYVSLLESTRPMVFLPIGQNHETGVTLHVRTAGDPGTLVGPLREALQVLEPNLPVRNVRTVSENIATSLYAARMGTMLIAALGVLALGLAALGVYGVMAYSIGRRTREVGIRVALGATRRDVIGLVLREGLALVAVGAAVGLVAAFSLANLLSSFLVGVRAYDAPAFVIAPVVLGCVAIAACVVPAWRALRVDPTEALRQS